MGISAALGEPPKELFEALADTPDEAQALYERTRAMQQMDQARRNGNGRF